jgi:hypothetical protein
MAYKTSVTSMNIENELKNIKELLQGDNGENS